MDSEYAGRSHRDFFSEHPDDVAARERELVEDKPLVQADVLTSEQSSVPLSCIHMLLYYPNNLITSAIYMYMLVLCQIK